MVRIFHFSACYSPKPILQTPKCIHINDDIHRNLKLGNFIDKDYDLEILVCDVGRVYRQEARKPYL